MKEIKFLEEIPKNTRACLYGASSQAALLLEALAIRKDVVVPFLVDTYKRGKLSGIDILPPCNLKDRRTDYDLVIITSAHEKEVLHTIESMDVQHVVKAHKHLFVRCSTVYLPSAGKNKFHTIFLELTGMCNMSCSFCRQPGLRPEKEHMDYGLFKEIINQIAENRLAKTIYLFGWGESLLYPRIMEAVEYCKSKSLSPEIVTNGLLLTKEVYLDLVSAGIESIYFSFHNLSEETFFHRHAHNRMTYGDYFKSLIGLIDTHLKSQNDVRIIVGLIFSKKEWIASDLMPVSSMKKETADAVRLFEPFRKEMQRLARAHGVECKLNREKFKRNLSQLKENGSQRILNIMQNVHLALGPLTTDAHLASKLRMRGTYEGIFEFQEASSGLCTAISQPMILADGSFTPCCAGAIPMGKIGEKKSLVSILASEEYRSLMDGFSKNKVVHKTCQECMGKYIKIEDLVSLASE